MGGVAVVNQPGVYLVDADGNVISLADGAAIGSAEGLLLMGKDGSNARIVRLDSNGDLVALPLPAGAATEATLAAADAKLGTIDSILDSIKDTDGIKKITDELPAGTQEIGSVAQGTKAAASGAWPTVLYDSSGNPIGVVLDGAIYRIQTQAQISDPIGQKEMAESIAVTLASDQVPPDNLITSGTITVINGTVEADSAGWNSCAVVLTGTWTGSVMFEGSSDGGTTWFAGLFVEPPPTMPVPALVPLMSQNGTFQCIGVGSTDKIRIRAVTPVTGTIEVKLVLSLSPQSALTAFTTMLQNVVVSTSNSSTTPLAARGIFTGGTATTLGVAGLQVNFIADQDCQIYVEQSIDGTNWDICDDFITEAGIGYGRTFQATASYWRVRIQNLAWVDCTYLRLQSVQCPIVEALPRSLGQKVMQNSLAVTVASDQTLPIVGRDTDGTETNLAHEETLFESRTVMQDVHLELRRIRVLLEILTDEHVEENYIEVRQ